jgi:hypothetical protein
VLSKLTIAFIALTAAVGVAACSSFANATIGGNGIGPNFPSQTLYATNSNENAVSIYNPGQKSGTGPAYEIGGASTTLDSPQYLAFDNAGNLWITNYNPSTNKALLVEIAALATGNVTPLFSSTISGHPRGVAITPKTTATPSPSAIRPNATSSPSPSPSTSPTPIPALMVIASVIPTEKYPSQLLLFTEGSTTPYQSIAGPKPNLSVPGGVAIDRRDNIYVANAQGASVDQFMLPTPSPTPKPTPTPTSTPSPTPSPSVSPSPTPTPSPTPSPINILPIFSLTGGNTHIMRPTSVAVDSSANVYISDLGAAGATCKTTGKQPAVLIFLHPSRKGLLNVPPTRIIAGCATNLKAPTDVKIGSNGLIYVADTSQTGNVVWIFAATAGGRTPASENTPPMGYYTSPGAVTGIGIVP